MRSILLLLLSVFSSALFAQQAAFLVPPAPAIAAKSYVLFDFHSGQTLAAHDPYARMEPASLTKLMTAYLTFAALKQKRIRPDQTVPVSERAWRTEGSRMFIEPRKPVTVDELIRGMIVQSGNDACIALAEAIAGSEEAFAEMMNREAQRLGLKNTRFVEFDRTVAPAALFHRARSRRAGGGGNPRFPRVLPALLAEGVPLQQHHAVQP